MSGSFTQRGEIACFDKYIRAEAALLCGADIILEIPTIFSTSSAKEFAAAGVSLGETGAGGCQSVDIGCLDIFVAIAGQIAVPHVVGQNKNDVWALRRSLLGFAGCLCLLGQQRTHGHQNVLHNHAICLQNYEIIINFPL